MKQRLKNIIVAIALWFFLPFAILNYIYCFKERFLAVCIIAIAITICIFSCSCSVDLNIVDITSAYNKGTHRTITTYIVIHHTAGEGATPAYIAKLHLSKWSSIGYHYFIDTNGTVYNLRSDDESEVPHALGFNDCCVAIIDGEGLKKWKPDSLVKEAIEYYCKFKPMASYLLEDTRVAIDKVRKFLKDIDLNAVDANGKPIYTISNVVTAIKQIPLLVKQLDEAERAMNKDLEAVSKMRGNAEKSLMADGFLD